jgi:hypothetical protein
LGIVHPGKWLELAPWASKIGLETNSPALQAIYASISAAIPRITVAYLGCF